MSNTALGASVGASFSANTPAFGGATPTVNEYSSSGGVPIIFDKFGNRTLSGEVRQQPRFVGPDAVQTSTYFSYLPGKYYGTTAATAHVAAVAALMLQLKGGPKSMLPSEIFSILERTAIDMDDISTDGFDVGFDYNTGGGLVNATAALSVANVTKPLTKAPTKAPTKTPTKAPTKAPVKAPISFPNPVPLPVPVVAPLRPPCGLLGWSIFCPRTRCGILGRWIGICRWTP
jgi:subtilisin family serine protease